RRHSDNDDAHQKAITCRPPKNGGRIPETGPSQYARDLHEIPLCRKNSIRTDEPANLIRQRIECGKKYQSERSKKKPACNKITGRREIRAEQPPRNRAEIEVHGRPLYRHILQTWVRHRTEK